MEENYQGFYEIISEGTDGLFKKGDLWYVYPVAGTYCIVLYCDRTDTIIYTNIIPKFHYRGCYNKPSTMYIQLFYIDNIGQIHTACAFYYSYYPEERMDPRSNIFNRVMMDLDSCQDYWTNINSFTEYMEPELDHITERCVIKKDSKKVQEDIVDGIRITTTYTIEFGDVYTEEELKKKLSLPYIDMKSCNIIDNGTGPYTWKFAEIKTYKLSPPATAEN